MGLTPSHQDTFFPAGLYALNSAPGDDAMRRQTAVSSDRPWSVETGAPSPIEGEVHVSATEVGQQRLCVAEWCCEEIGGSQQHFEALG